MGNNLVFSIMGNDKTGGAFTSVTNNLRSTMGVVDEAQKKLSVFGKKAAGIGAVASAGITAPILAAAKGVVSVGAEFEAVMNRIQGTSQAPISEMEALRNKAKELGSTTRFSASESAAAIETLANNGLNVEQILGGALQASIAASSALGGELAASADLATDVMAQFSKPAAEMTGIVDTLAAIRTNSKFDFGDITLAIGNAGEIAANAGLDFNELAVGLTATASSFTNGADAGTSFKTFVTSLTGNSDKAKGMIDKLGISFYDLQGDLKPLPSIAQELQDGLSGLTQEDRTGALKQIFGNDAFRTGAALAKQGAAGIESIAASMEKVSAQTLAEANMKGFSGAMAELRSAFEGVQLAASDSGLLDTLTGVVRFATDIVGKVATADPAIVKIGTAVAAAAAVIGPLVMAGGAFAMFLGALSAPAVGLIAVAGLAVGGLVTFREELAGAFSTVMENVAFEVFQFQKNFPALSGALVATGEVLKTVFIAAFEAAGETVGRVVTAIGVAVEGVKTVVTSVVTAIDAVFRGDMAAAIDAGGQAFTGLLTTVTTTLDTLFGGVVTRVGEIASAVINGLSAGITDKIETVKASISGIGSAIITAFKETLGIASPSKVFSGLGGAIMDGLRVGINGAWEAVKASIKDKVDWLPGWAKTRLGIASPSRVFAAIGGNVVDGLRVGIEDKAETIKPVMDDLSSTMTETLGEIGGGVSGLLKSALRDGELSFESLRDVATGAMESMRDRLLDQTFKPMETALDNLIGKVVDGLGGALSGSSSGGGLFSGIGSMLGGAFAGFFADGGVIGPGQFGIVGERGPEFAFGGTSGQTIVPFGKGKGGGGEGVVVNLTNNIAADMDEAAWRRRSAQLKSETVAAVQQAHSRNLGYLR